MALHGEGLKRPKIKVDFQGSRVTSDSGLVHALSALIGILFVSDYGGGGAQGSSSAPVSYPIGGTVINPGGTGRGIQLQDKRRRQPVGECQWDFHFSHSPCQRKHLQHYGLRATFIPSRRPVRLRMALGQATSNVS
jgi:hypothetical protein